MSFWPFFYRYLQSVKGFRMILKFSEGFRMSCMQKCWKLKKINIQIHMSIYTFMNPGIRDILSTDYPRDGMFCRVWDLLYIPQTMWLCGTSYFSQCDSYMTSVGMVRWSHVFWTVSSHTLSTFMHICKVLVFFFWKVLESSHSPVGRTMFSLTTRWQQCIMISFK